MNEVVRKLNEAKDLVGPLMTKREIHLVRNKLSVAIRLISADYVRRVPASDFPECCLQSHPKDAT